MVDTSVTLLSQASPTKVGFGSDTGSANDTEGNTSQASLKKTTIH